MKVLFIDDDSLTVEWVTFYLHSNNIEIRSADSIAGALSCLGEWVPDLIVSDLTLKDDDAFALLNHLQSNQNTLHIPVIAVTGHQLNATEQQKFHGYLMKPVEPDELLKIIHLFAPSG